MEWLWWALLLFVIIGWPLLFVALNVIRRRVLGAPSEEDALREHAELMALKDVEDMRNSSRF
ncbi:MAG: hypothetical protein HYU87_01455 [Chloroflexi bacterium]|nr:hypothetical protein [Chloroflexota bacterium]